MVAKSVLINRKREASPTALPGQMLHNPLELRRIHGVTMAYRLPKPKAQVAGSAVEWSTSRKRSGMNCLGGYFTFGSCAICL